MCKKVLVYDREIRYSDLDREYFMVPNFLYDEGENIELSVNSRHAFGYMIRKANKQNKENGKQDIIFFSFDELARKCGFSISTAKKVTKELIDQEYIRKVSTGSNLTGRANTYRILFPYPKYVEGVEVEINIVKRELPQQAIDELLAKGTGKIYYYWEDGVYSHKKKLPLKIDLETGEVGLHVQYIEQGLLYVWLALR